MITIIKNGEIYSPKYIGKKDIVIVGDKIEGIYDEAHISSKYVNVEIINAQNKLIFPGFIDSHIHIIGGGGEGGYVTRTPEIMLSDILYGGITTVVGCLGTDAISRNIKDLLCKARALEEEGITTYILTGSYEIPLKTLTESPSTDIVVIDKIIGVGEVALADHRSSQPTYEEFLKVVSAARVAGLLSGKAGIVNIHIGNGKAKLQYLHRILDETEIPVTQLIPTHINRNTDLLIAGVEYAKLGGIIDLTTSSDPEHLEEGEVRASEAIKYLIDSGVSISKIQLSSDAQGSLPLFDYEGKFIGLGIGSATSLYREVRDAIQNKNIPIEEAVKTVTSNVAEHLKLCQKGRIEIGMDADIVFVDKGTLKVTDVISRGKKMIIDGEKVWKGIFER